MNDVLLKKHPWTVIDRQLSSSRITVYYDDYPVSQGHRLFVPADNTYSNIFEAFTLAYTYGSDQVKRKIVDGFNVGMNYGSAAGQTVEWPVVHYIPRYKDDVSDPTGGIRHVIPSRGNYKTSDHYKNQKSWKTTVQEDGTVELPLDLLDTLGWAENDTLFLEALDDGTFLLKKAEK